jgi:hypothetical protein
MIVMAKGTKKQHFVPQSLLHRFTGEGGGLYVYNMAADRSYPSTVRDAGHQNHFLTSPALDGEAGPGMHYERFFQTYEGPADKAIKTVEATLACGIVKLVGGSEREALARFVAVQYVRTPEARERTSQMAELTQRVIATEIARRNGYDPDEPEIGRIIAKFADDARADEVALHSETILQPGYVDEIADVLSKHVWLLSVNRTPAPLYITDNPVAIHAHVERPGRGVGLGTYGVEVMMPLSSTLHLCLVEREFVRAEAPPLERMDGCLYTSLTPDNVLFQRSLQVRAARQFVYCAADDFTLAREMCDASPELRDPQRPRVEANAFGRHEVARRRE